MKPLGRILLLEVYVGGILALGVPQPPPTAVIQSVQLPASGNHARQALAVVALDGRISPRAPSPVVAAVEPPPGLSSESTDAEIPPPPPASSGSASASQSAALDDSSAPLTVTKDEATPPLPATEETERDSETKLLHWIEVHHQKLPGSGYSKGSPLYPKQEARRSASDGAYASGIEAFLFPMPTSMKCVIDLTAQFFVVYTVLFVLQTLNRLKMLDREREEKNLVAVVETVFFVPMLCILFLAVRLRAIQLCKGRPVEAYDLPQWWVKFAMVLCTWCVQLLTILVIACAMHYGESWEALAKRDGVSRLGMVMLTFRNVVVLVIYGSFTVICVGICVMQPPTQIWGETGGPRVSAAVSCIILLAVLYFAVYLALACARLVNELGVLGPTRRFSQVNEFLKSATTILAFVPMLGCLFIASRLRATQLDPERGNPQLWVQVAFYICTFSVLLQTLLAVASAVVSARVRDARSLSIRLRGLEGMRLVFMTSLYVGVVAIIVGMYSEDSPLGGAPALPPSLKCVALLTALYFAVYLALWIVLAIQRNKSEASSSSSPAQRGLLPALEVFLAVRAKEAVAFCPMFCVLFLGTLMRALQITDNKGVPQAWCQNFQIVASWAIVFLIASRVDVLVPGTSRDLINTCTLLQYTFLLVLYVCAIAMVVALFTMSPENAYGPGAIAF